MMDVQFHPRDAYLFDAAGLRVEAVRQTQPELA
jgi:hypothetical protein